MAAKPKIIYILHLATSEIFVLYVLCVCSAILSLYPYQTDTEHTTVMLVQLTELHGEVSWSTNMLKVHLVTALDNIPKVVGSSPNVVMHILCFFGVKILSE